MKQHIRMNLSAVFVFLTCCAPWSMPVFGQDPLLVGVIDFETRGVEESEARTIADRMRIYLNRSEVFDVLERQRMNEILDEQGFQISGACDTDECVVQVGRILGARKMIAGSVSKLGMVYTLQMRIIDVTTGRIEETAYADTRGNIEEVLTDATLEASIGLISAVRESRGLPQPKDRLVEEARLLGHTGPLRIPDGFFVILNAGGASADAITESDFAADLTGGGMGMDLGLGAGLTERLSVSMQYSGTFGRIDFDYGDRVESAASDSSVQLSWLSLGASYYLIPRSLYIRVSLAFPGWQIYKKTGSISSDDYVSKVVASGRYGLGTDIRIGKDWWVSRTVCTGLMVRVLLSSNIKSYGLLGRFLFDF